MRHAKSAGVLVILVMVLGALAVGILSPPSVGSLTAGTASADPAVPNPGHSWTEIEIPTGTWTGLDADKVDGLNANEIGGGGGRPGFSITFFDSSLGIRGLWTSVTVGADGLALISYYDALIDISHLNYDLKVAHCSNTACTAATLTTLDGAADVGQYTSVTIGSDGLGLISYYDSSNGDLKVAHCSNTACTAATLTTLDSAGSVGLYTSVTVGTDGLGLISYRDSWPNYDLKVAHCSDVACTTATITTLDSASDVGLYTSVTVGTDGLGLISYYDSTNGDLKVAHCSDVACTAATLTTLDSAGDVGRYTSVTVGYDGLGLISYYDSSNGDLKVAHCSDVACSAATITTLDSAGDVGQYTSVTVGTDGLEFISYSTYSTNCASGCYLKVAHCSNAACTSATITTLGGGDIGKYTSVTVGTDGLPLISYYGNYNLTVAHCSNRFCVPYHRPR